MPPYIDVPLDTEGIAYPVNGEMVEAYGVRMFCFGAKHYLQTWELRQRVVKANVNLVSLYRDIEHDTKEEISEISGEQFGQMMLMGGFELNCALEEFKQLVVGNRLIELDEEVYLTKERWQQCSDVVKEKLIFAYLAVFIQPCVM